ncbi:MAG: hypothetical protein ACRC80_34800 [Waterburya sp.]
MSINLTNASLSELKIYCQENDITVIGDRRRKQSYIDSINNQVSFNEIIEHTKTVTDNLGTDRTSLSFNYIDNAVTLDFTLHGDYIGSTIERSNYHVMLEKLKAICDIDQVNLKYEYSLNKYNTYAIQITGNLPLRVWNEIKKWCDRVLLYPIIDDCHYSDMCVNDCVDAWNDRQYNEVANELYRKYRIDLDVFANSKYNTSDKLYDFMDHCGFLDEISDDEVNSYAYWDIDDNRIDDLANALNEHHTFMVA